MVDLTPSFQETLRRVVLAAIEARSGHEPEFNTAYIAKQLGVSQRTLQHYLETGEGARHCPARIVPALSLVLGTDEILDTFESAAGRVAFRPFIDPSGSSATVGGTSALLVEVGEALRRVGEALRDGFVDDGELQKTLPALDDVIRECAALKNWLRVRHQQDSGKRHRQPG